jgi:hypothetical protein
MALILVASGNVYQFTTIRHVNNIQWLKSQDHKKFMIKRFLTGLTIHGGNNATLTTETGSTAILNGITEINGTHEFKYYDVVAPLDY